MTAERSDQGKRASEPVPPRKAADAPSAPLPLRDEDELPIEDLPPRRNVTGG